MEKDKRKESEMSWCVFGDPYLQNYGRIIRTSNNNRVIYIETSEGATPAEWWNKPRDIKRTATLKDAVVRLYKSDIKNFDGCNSLEVYLEDAELRFPGQLKKEEELDLAIKKAEFYVIL